MKLEEYISLDKTRASNLLQSEKPWENIARIKQYIYQLSKELTSDYLEIENEVWVHKSVTIAKSATLVGPIIIDEGSVIRVGAYLRGNCLIGKNCVVGNSCELKNVILCDNVQVPHFNYVGDSILGYKAHLGAGAITSNYKSDHSEVIIKGERESHPSSLTKMGAIVGDFVEVGCNSVLNPGTVIGKNTTIYPLTSIRGIIGANKIIKSGEFKIVDKRF